MARAFALTGLQGDGPASGSLDLAARLRDHFGDEVDPGVTLEAEPGPASDPPPSGSGSAWREVLGRLGTHSPAEGRYRIKGEVARGGMGRILRIWDSDLRRTLAKKVLRKADSLGPAGPPDRVVGRFLEEAQVTAQLEHPGIVPVHELGLDEHGELYFTMRLVKGQDLRAILKALREGDDRWTLGRILDVVQRVCDAVAYAHSKGVIHRDLKPANIMVGRFGETYVMDWGLAKILDLDGRTDAAPPRPEGPAASLSTVQTDRQQGGSSRPDDPLFTLHGDAVGTPAYMSPEQAAGDLDTLGPAADVYAVGAILYEVLTGHCPYLPSETPLSPYDVLVLVKQGPPRPLHSLAPRVPPGLAAICERAMARRPEHRYPGMEALGEDLRRFRENRTVAAYRTGALAELGTWVRRNRLSAAALVVLVVVLAASGTVAAWLEGERADAAEGRLVEQAARILRADLLEAPLDLPLTPENVPPREAWLAETRAFVAGLPDVRGLLEALRQEAAPASPEETEHDRRTHPRGRLLAELESRREQMALERSKDRAQADAPEVSAREQERARHSIPLLDREIRDLDGRIADLVETVTARRTWRFEDPADQARHDVLAETVEVLEALEHPRDGTLARVEAQVIRSRGLEAETVDDHLAAWTACLASLADDAPGAAPPLLAPVPGLVPLGRNPRSGLWEFWHVLTGDRPVEAEPGRWRVTEGSGLVMVLLPGGTVVTGAQNDDPGGPRHDPLAHDIEGPPWSFPLDPYFLSKFELTQDQFQRLAEHNPSRWFAGVEPQFGLRHSRLHPVETVSWSTATTVLARVGLVLPTEVQWEAAARGGTETPYWWGSELVAQPPPVNLADYAFARARDASARAADHPLDDGWPLHAPVTGAPPNPYGLHQVLGNVAEWCRDAYRAGYDGVRTTSGTGEIEAPHGFGHVYRGGYFRDDPERLRVTTRNYLTPGEAGEGVGIRPAIDITPPR